MKVNANTKIAYLIKQDRGVIDVISGINKHFNKLKNPILCKMLASRVSISEAARIGKVSVEYFLEKLEAAGFEVEYPHGAPAPNELQNKTTVTMNKTNLITLDARPILEGGIDPFEEIMKTLKGMRDDQTLLVINTFEPLPLLNLLKKKGYEYLVERPETGLVNTYLRKSEEAPLKESKQTGVPKKTPAFEAVESEWAGKMREIDVHDMEMPMPMVSILEALEKLPAGEALYVHHKQLPQYLLPELESRGFQYVEKKIDDAHLKMIIYK